MPTIHLFPWFDDQAEQAMNFYLSVFADSKVDKVMRYGEGGGASGKRDYSRVRTGGAGVHGVERRAAFQVHRCGVVRGHMLRSGGSGPVQGKAFEGGAPGQCGWPRDRFGLSRQIVPAEMPVLPGGPDPDEAKRAMEAMMNMTKLDIAGLKTAREG